MTAQLSAATTGSSYRFAGWAAIASGLIGIIAIGTLFVGKSIWFTAQAGHDPELFKVFDFWFQTYNVGISLQCLLMIPVVFALHSLARQRFPGIGRGNLVLGVVSLSLVVICALLYLPKVVADDLHLIPLGSLGVWLMIISRRKSTVLSRGLARFGSVVGFGLLLVGIFPLAYGIFVDPIGLRGPIPLDYPNKYTVASDILEYVFFIGMLLGVLPFPIWSILLGRRLLRERCS